MKRRTTSLGLALVLLGCVEADPPTTTKIADTKDDAPIPIETVRALEALGYFATAPTDNPDARGVTTAAASAEPGLALYSSRHEASAVLIDHEGEIVHRWRDPAADEPRRSWMHVEPLPGGALLAIVKDEEILKVDRGSNVVWRHEIRAHHDLAVHEDGRIFVLVRDRTEHRFDRGEAVPVLADAIAILSAEGELLSRVELLPLVERLVRPGRIERIRAAVARDVRPGELFTPGGVADVLHTNSIAFLHSDIDGVAPSGSVILSMRNADRIAILSAGLDEVLWTWGRGELQRQHDATQLANGHILLFDNGPMRAHSRVLEVNPRTGEIVWSYAPRNLFSRLRGGAQELPSGNILITESDRGHALEITRGGEVVWEYWNPDVRGGPEAERAVIYRLNRFDAELFEPG